MNWEVGKGLEETYKIYHHLNRNIPWRTAAEYFDSAVCVLDQLLSQSETPGEDISESFQSGQIAETDTRLWALARNRSWHVLCLKTFCWYLWEWRQWPCPRTNSPLTQPGSAQVSRQKARLLCTLCESDVLQYCCLSNRVSGRMPILFS